MIGDEFPKQMHGDFVMPAGALSILIWYYHRIEEHEDVVRRTPLARQTIQFCLGNDLMVCNYIKDGMRQYSITPKGQYYIDHGLSQVPLPVEAVRFYIPTTGAEHGN